MASLISPGIIIKERDLTTAVVTNTSASTAGFASTFARGPVGEIVTISSQKQLLDIFGTPKAANAEDYFVASEFLNYGGRLAVVRAETGTNTANTGSNASLNVKNEADWDGGLGSGEDFIARTPGAWGNALKVIIVDRGPDQVITLANAPATVPSAGDTITFNLNGGGTSTAVVRSIASADTVLTVALTDATKRISSADELEDGGTDVAITSAVDWYATTTVSGIKLSQIGPRPGTSAYAEARGLKYDEVHVAILTLLATSVELLELSSSV